MSTTKEQAISTSERELMGCQNKYVITDTDRLVSPAGHHPDDRIFVQTKIAIHCDTIPRILPASNKGLWCHEIEKVIS